MVKFLKPGKVVILLTGRYAGKKAVIVKNYDDGTSSRPYGHAIVCGLSKEPRKVIKRSSQKTQARRSSLKTFIKVVNYQHLMPTRYTLEVELKGVVTAECVDNSTKKEEANKAAKALLEDKFKSGKNRWFFSRLRF
ncbi:MORN repeat family [Micractinium conductrix]|uniref:60S ribosomal protein L27 n=1 Tax=Micractinium conductrix TaxID=554055 RepID=A0A2P6VP41_9CHLO|nr:MORN repeat family [Micractinium conductrix]|eukprot:PSC75829.1 MORN repeat family [Micractinium conductrix]